MSVDRQKVDTKIIENFLHGNNPKKYVVSIEAGYGEPLVSLIINDPNEGKKIEKAKYQPFVWFKEEVASIIYEGKRKKIIEARTKFNIKFKKLKTSSSDLESGPYRLENGYKYIAQCNGSYNTLVQFFKEGGIDIFDKEYSKLFVMFSPVEQFMIQTGVRLFKGMDDYDDLHRFQFDLETEGLSGTKDAIFQIGMRDNRGFEFVLETKGDTPFERRNSERENILSFFNVIDTIRPDVIMGYNSESFDWKFIMDRCERLSIPIQEIALGLDGKSKLKRKPAMLKLGNEMESFDQTYIFGHNIIDIAHSVRRAQAINSDIKSWGLKYITMYSGIAKKNRVYLKGDRIHTTWNDKINKYALNDENGDWYKISEDKPLKDGYTMVAGDYIVQRYLLDDLWETEQVDGIFNQAAFLISKLLPTTYCRSSTMGTATQWKLIMAAWSYENGLAIPETEKKRDFTGGLSRLLRLGYARNIAKLDYAALYPKNQLTNDIFPDLDISGVMFGLLTYVVDTRDEFKFLTTEEKDKAKAIQKRIDNEKDTLSLEELVELKKQLNEHKRLASLYDKKQLPLKILANSWFGAYGAPYIFNWGDSDCAEETTCRGRQYLRLMVRHFTEKYNFVPLVGDTDGFNFSFPDNIDEIKYVAKGSHWKTKKYEGKELIGLEAALAEFNENYMIGRMGLDIDDIYESTINFSRKNYANLLNGKVKLVGNSIKSKKMPKYIEEFLSVAIKMLLLGKGKDFISYYYEYVDKIYNYNIPLVKIASKSKVKTTISEYKKKANKKNKAGNPMPKQAHMELVIRANVDINLGDTIHYVNTGKSKSDGDIKTIYSSKMTKKELFDYEANNGHLPKFDSEIQINSKLIDSSVIESNMDIIKEIEMLRKELIDITDANKIDDIESKIIELESQLITDDYNVAKYIDAFNNKMKPLLVCFHPDIRHKILLNIKKDKKTKNDILQERLIFTEAQCELVSGMPDKPEDQDSYDEDLMMMEDKEIKFWDKVNKIPNNIDVDEWEKIRIDYQERLTKIKIEGIANEKEVLDGIFNSLEVDDIRKVENSHLLPDDLLMIATLSDSGDFISRKWGEVLCVFYDIFKYKKQAIERHDWYQLSNNTSNDRFQQWLDYKSEQVVNVDINDEYITPIINNISIDLLKQNVSSFEEMLQLKKVVITEEEDDEEDEDDEDLESDDGIISEIVKADFEMETEDDTYVTETIIEITEEKDILTIIKEMPRVENDDWNF